MIGPATCYEALCCAARVHSRQCRVLQCYRVENEYKWHWPPSTAHHVGGRVNERGVSPRCYSNDTQQTAARTSVRSSRD